MSSNEVLLIWVDNRFVIEKQACVYGLNSQIMKMVLRILINDFEFILIVVNRPTSCVNIISSYEV